ncbi:MAG: MDR family oxidoreductase, partial [Alphaproteobacteria bacterium]
MAADSFTALVLDQQNDKVSGALQQLEAGALPEGDVTVRVAYSSLNYKDGLILGGLGRLVRDYPHVPGIDLAGTVEASDSPAYQPGDEVVLTGWFVGERHWGGYAQRARVNSQWLVPMPESLDSRRAMALGTAGFTAMLCIMALEEHGLEPDAGEVLVSGAAGGVGSVAVAALAGLGHRVVASTGRPETHDYLSSLGATDFIDRAELAEASGKPLASERWAGAVDTVGGQTLAAIVAGLRYGASVAACGNAGGLAVPTNVLPFILRGVNLLGIDSVRCPLERRRRTWARCARDLAPDKLDAVTRVVPLGEVLDLGPKILKGEVRGRVVVDVN